MTNRERLANMSDKELAEFLNDLTWGGDCTICVNHATGKCTECDNYKNVEKWLKQEYREATND
jgi:hypothetical protein